MLFAEQQKPNQHICCLLANQCRKTAEGREKHSRPPAHPTNKNLHTSRYQPFSQYPNFNEKKNNKKVTHAKSTVQVYKSEPC